MYVGLFFNSAVCSPSILAIPLRDVNFSRPKPQTWDWTWFREGLFRNVFVEIDLQFYSIMRIFTNLHFSFRIVKTVYVESNNINAVLHEALLANCVLFRTIRNISIENFSLWTPLDSFYFERYSKEEWRENVSESNSERKESSKNRENAMWFSSHVLFPFCFCFRVKKIDFCGMQTVAWATPR